MKILFLLLLASPFSFFAQQTTNNLPEINAGMIRFVNEFMGKKVGTGECWDLVQIPLDELGADWDGDAVFGKKLDPKKDEILPGDIIQFERVVVKFIEGKMEMTENYAHHTAIVFQVISPENYKIAHQNTGYAGKKVIVSPLILSNVKKGKMTFYRPVKK